MIDPSKEFSGVTCTFNTTEDCNLACKYCYEINKKRKTLDIETAKKFIDLLIDTENPCHIPKEDDRAQSLYTGIILDFIGGDALMKPKLCDEILTYFSTQVYLKDTPNAKKWRNHWRCSISTNGTLFSDPEVRAFCRDWRDSLSIGVSLDGCPELHDLNRVYVDGRGTMSDIMKNWDWYREMFPVDALGTKATLAKNSIPYIDKSVRFLYNEMGIRYINMNFCMENMGYDHNDALLLCKEFDKALPFVLDHRNTMYWSMIDKLCIISDDPNEQKKLHDDNWNKAKCGSGVMPALAIDGKIYPCFRWLPHTQEKDGVMSAGSVGKGFNHPENFAKVREGGIRCHCTKDPKCMTCKYETACPYCIGGCYSEFGDFIRTTHICELTKVQCEYAKKYWNLYKQMEEKIVYE